MRSLLQVYTAKHPLYSDTIFPHTRPADDPEHPGRRQIIAAKVTLGRMFDHGREIPARRPAGNEPGYHSRGGTENDMQFAGMRNWRERLAAAGQLRDDHPVRRLMDNGAEFGRQYVVHRSSQVYPAYIVTYTNPNNPG